MLNSVKTSIYLPGVTVSRSHNEQSVTVSAGDYEETTDESLPPANIQGNDPYYREEKRKWIGTNDTGECGICM